MRKPLGGQVESEMQVVVGEPIQAAGQNGAMVESAGFVSPPSGGGF